MIQQMPIMDGTKMNTVLPIAVVDDDPAVRELLSDVLIDEGYTPHLFDGTDGTYQGIRAVSPAVVILDLHVGEPDAGWALLNHIGADPALERAAIIICSGDDTGLDEHRAALEGRTHAVLPKPFDLDDLAALLQRLTYQRLTYQTTPDHDRMRLLGGVQP